MVKGNTLLLAAGLAGVNAVSWSEARAQADALVAQMTNEEKMNITYGFPSNCIGQTGSVNRLKIPGLCLGDAGNGVRQTDFVNAYAGGISVAASWNKGLSYRRGSYMGAEFKRKGNHAALGPVVGPIGRTAKGGRNFEGFGSDPYLAGQLAANTIQGLQENVIAVVKHFIYNEQETLRSGDLVKLAVSANVDDVTAHELYLWPFQDAVRADVGSVMSSYNRINGTYASQNFDTQTKLLKQELGFPGFVVSDWGGQHSGAPSAVSGLDMAMPASDGFWKGLLPTFVANGTLTQQRFDDMVARTLTSWIKIIGGPGADFPEPGIGMYSEIDTPRPLIDARDPESKQTILEGAIEGHVLLKNTNNALPLKKPKMLSLYGFDATIPKKFYPTPPKSLDFIYNLGYESLGLNTSAILSLLVAGLGATGISDSAPQAAVAGALWNGGGSGTNHPSALSDTYGAIQQRARKDDIFLYWNFEEYQNITVSPLSSACLVFVNEISTELFDRKTLSPAIADTLIVEVASKCNNTIVVTHNPAIRTASWADNANVTAIIYAHYPGQDLGESLAQVLFGEVSPTGRLPYTVAKQDSDYGSLMNPCLQGNITADPYCDFSEGIYTDYRHFQKNGITPRYAFGYGLTYTTFKYSNFTAGWYTNEDKSTAPPNPADVGPGGVKSLWDEIAVAQITIENTGDAFAAEVPQLYVHFPGEGPNVHFLRGFEKVWLAPRTAWTQCFQLTRRDLSRWNTVTQRWEIPSGDIELRIGASAEDIKYAITLKH